MPGVYTQKVVCNCSEALPFFLLLVDLSKACTLAKYALSSLSQVPCVVLCATELAPDFRNILGRFLRLSQDRRKFVPSHEVKISQVCRRIFITQFTEEIL